jgi:hypothetical protein
VRVSPALSKTLRAASTNISRTFAGKRINRKLAKSIARGKGRFIGFTRCRKVGSYNCMTISTGSARKFTSYAIIDKPCPKAGRRRHTTTRASMTCFGGYMLASKARAKTTGWMKVGYTTREGKQRTKQSQDTKTWLYMAVKVGRSIRMKLRGRIEYRVEVFSSSQINTTLSIYDAKGNYLRDPSLCPPNGLCKNLSSTYIEASSGTNIKSCDSRYGDGGLQDTLIDTGTDIVVKGFTVLGTLIGMELGAGVGGAAGGFVGYSVGKGAEWALQQFDKKMRQKKLAACRASYKCDKGKATADGVSGCTCRKGDRNESDPDSCASAKKKAESEKSTTTAAKGGNDGTTPPGGMCYSSADCPAGWTCNTATKMCVQD